MRFGVGAIQGLGLSDPKDKEPDCLRISLRNSDVASHRMSSMIRLTESSNAAISQMTMTTSTTIIMGPVPENTHRNDLRKDKDEDRDSILKPQW